MTPERQPIFRRNSLNRSNVIKVSDSSHLFRYIPCNCLTYTSQYGWIKNGRSRKEAGQTLPSSALGITVNTSCINRFSTRAPESESFQNDYMCLCTWSNLWSCTLHRIQNNALWHVFYGIGSGFFHQAGDKESYFFVPLQQLSIWTWCTCKSDFTSGN